MTTQELGEGILAYIHLWNDPTFRELWNNLPETRGDLRFIHPDVPNAILAYDVSREFIEALDLIRDRVEWRVIGKKLRKHYERPTFVLVELRLTNDERKRRGQPTRKQVMDAVFCPRPSVQAL